METNGNVDDKLHTMLIDRANADASKRLNDKQKRFGKSHDLDDELIERARVALANANSLSELMGQYGLLIPARSIALWRPTKRSVGMVNGVREGLTIIATDGILGWFLTTDTEEPWQGHIQCFDGDIEPLHSCNFQGTMASKSNPKVKRARKKSARTLLLETI